MFKVVESKVLPVLDVGIAGKGGGQIGAGVVRPPLACFEAAAEAYGLAVVAQIPCSYCIWADAMSAQAAGASDEEIREAVAIAATERYWSTMLNGMEVDLDIFKQEVGSSWK